MKRISRTFLTGLATILPIVATFYILFWLAASAESVIGAFLEYVLPDHLYHPGMGVAAGAALVFLTGLLMHAWIVRKLFAWGDNLLYRVPLIKSIYGSIRELLQFFSRPGEDGKAFHQVVMVSLGDTGTQLMGFVTRNGSDGLADGISGEDKVAVYLPLSYQIGGHTLMVPRSAIRPLDISIREAMRFVFTAGMTGGSPGSTTRRHTPSKR
jgi:uncharacterized membrane protein